MARLCLLYGPKCSNQGRAVAGRSRCSVHGPTSPRGPSKYDATHQRYAKLTLDRAAGCASPTHDERRHPVGPDNPLQADHIVPLSLGGRVEVSNYQALCRHCNISKGGANRRVGGEG